MTPAEELTQAHIEAQGRLTEITGAAVVAAWASLEAYDRPDVPTFLAMVLPIVRAATRQSVLLTAALLSRAIERPIAPDVDKIVSGIRNGTTLEETYERPFVTVWSDLADHRRYADAVAAGSARADASAQMDVRLAMTHTLRAVGDAEPLILGYRRVPNADACEFCKLIAGRRYLTKDLQPSHHRCKCSVGVITEANRADFFGKLDNDLALPAGVAIEHHGELGPVIGAPAHRDDIAA